jgi:ribosomal protein S7
LIKWILELSKGNLGCYISLDDISNACGDKKKNLKPLGWKDAEELVKAAEKAGYIVCIRKKSKISKIALKQQT